MAVTVAVTVFDSDGSTVIRRLDQLISLQWLDELADTGNFSLRTPTENAVGVEVGHIVKIALGEKSDDFIWAGVVESIKVEQSGQTEAVARVSVISGRGVRSLLEGAIVYPVDPSESKREFTNVSAGAIMKTLFDEAQARGAIPELTIDFSATADSGDNAYEETLTIDESVGSTLLAVASRHQELAVDVRVTPDLEVQYFNVFGSDLTAGLNPLVLRIGFNVGELTEEKSGPVRNTVLVERAGDGRFETVSDSPSVSAHARREMFLSMTSTRDVSLSVTAAESLLADVRAPGVAFKVEALPVGVSPILDYNVGDRVLLVDREGVATSLRVEAIAASLDAAGQMMFVPELGKVRPDMVRRLTNALSKVERATGAQVSDLSDRFGMDFDPGSGRLFDAEITAYNHGAFSGRVSIDDEEVTFVNITEKNFQIGERAVLTQVAPVPVDWDVNPIAGSIDTPDKVFLYAVGTFRPLIERVFFVAVIDDTSGVDQEDLDAYYAALREYSATAPIWLLVPGGATVALPEGWGENEADNGPFTVAIDNGVIDLADDFFEIIGIDPTVPTLVNYWSAAGAADLWEGGHFLFLANLSSAGVALNSGVGWPISGEDVNWVARVAFLAGIDLDGS